uniref:Acyl-CoA N-acyltransferase n=1 Tax=Tanacetum cinerariifolium TaxID=118510 RepID=A0A699H9N4_TANCI|nr:acyl-CoA N-acyltransferase [Tanacetum cinerariifolium]
MKDFERSIHSGEFIKKKSSSGCLIIRKKLPTTTNDSAAIGIKPFSDSSRTLFNNDTQLRKRPREEVTKSDSDEASDGDFTDPFRRKADKFNNGKDVYEYDGFRVRVDRSDFADRRDSGSGSGMRIYDKRRDFVRDDRGANTSRFDHETRVPGLGGRYGDVSDKPIRLQGKNGVLKVMVKKHKPISVPYQSYDRVEDVRRRESRPDVYVKKEVNVSREGRDYWDGGDKKKGLVGSSMYSDLRNPGVPVLNNGKQKSKIELANDDNDTPLYGNASRVHHLRNEKTVKLEKRITPPTKDVTPIKGKESKVKRGTGTEKQVLREKIRAMLLSAGWTIDYRPRRNRDYQDAVYINPAGTAYWSIIKAYEALQKDDKDFSQVEGDFTPLPVETLSKLTRQTKKKIEREMKMKRRDEGIFRNAKRDRAEVSVHQDSCDDDSDDGYYRKKVHQETVANRTAEGLKSRKLGRRTLLVRCGGNVSQDDGFVPYAGKRTLFSWLIESGTVQVGEKVQYMNSKKTRVMKEGWIANEGIRCCCCCKILTVLQFELHAGSKLRQPFLNIFVHSGKSLMQCQIDAWNKQGEIERKGFYAVDAVGDDPNDDTCGVCGDGGDLICCDGCPSTFHQSCLGIKMLPQGDWHCPNCSCKYCEMATEASAGIGSPLLKCHLCEKKYHESCSLHMNDKSIYHGDPNLSFCGQKCLELFSHLQKLLGVKHELDSGFFWSLIHRSDLSSDASPVELSERVECNSKLAVALSVIDECFLPFVERRSGINLIHNVVFNCGSNSSRLNYSGFFTAILERGDEMICAASIRIHGSQLAEMPFIGTRHMYRRQGMCRRLLSAIESALSSLHVEKLIIPAIAEHMHTWTDVFGFSPLDESHKKEMRSMSMVVFPRTDMLQKPLVQQVTPVNKMSTKMEGRIPKAQISESTSNVKEMIKSRSEDFRAPLDATISISSDKNDNLLPVCDSTARLEGVDTVMQNGEESTENIAHTVPIKAQNEHSDFMEAKSIVQDGKETSDKIATDHKFPKGKPASDYVLCHTKTSDDALLPKELASLDTQSVLNVKESNSKTLDLPLAKPCGIIEKESVSVSADTELNMDMRNGNIADAISVETHVKNDTTSPEPQLSGKESVTVSADSELNKDVQNGNVSDAIPVVTDVENDSVSPEPQLSGKESVSVDSESNIDVQNGKITDAIPVETQVQKDTISPEPQSSVKESVSMSADSEFNMGVQNGKTADSIPVETFVQKDTISFETELSGKESVLVSVNSEFNIDVQHGKIADAIPAETHVQNDTMSPEPQLSGKESVSISADSEFNIDVQNGNTADAIPVETHVQKDSISFEPQFSGKEPISVSADSELNFDVQNGKIADAISIETHIQNNTVSPEPQMSGGESVSVSADSELNIDVQNGKIADAISVETHVRNDTVSPEPQKSGKESVSVYVDSEFNFNVQNGETADDFPVETHVQKDSISFEPQYSGKESVSVSADSELNTDVQNAKIADAIPVETHVQNYTISSEPRLSGKELVSVYADSELNIDVQNGQIADAIPVETHVNDTVSPEPQMSGKESVSISVNSEFNIYAQNGKTADAYPVETHVQNDSISSAFQFSGKESVSVSDKFADAVPVETRVQNDIISPEPPSSGLEASLLDPRLAAEVQVGEVAALPLDKPCEITEELVPVSASSVFDINVQNGKIAGAIPHDNLAQMDTILPESQLSGLEALPLNPQSAAEVQIDKIPDLPSDDPCEITGKEPVSASADSDFNVQNGKTADIIPFETDGQNDTISPKPQMSGLEDLPVDPHIEVQNESTRKELVSVSADSDSNMNVQNSEIADAIPPDTHDQKEGHYFARTTTGWTRISPFT